MKPTKTIIKYINNLTTNERERARLIQVVDKDIENFSGHKFYKAKRNIGGKWKTVLLPILDSKDMKDFLSNQLETIRLASVIVSEYENGNTKQLIKM
jgi:hypothetical protein